MKSLFNKFADIIIQNSADLLQTDFTEEQINASSTSSATLVFNILQTLHTIFLYSNRPNNQSLREGSNNQSDRFNNRFNTLMEPLVNVLDNEDYLKEKNVQEILPKCFAQFTLTVNDDVLWKQLNHQILLKTRSDSVLVRLVW